MRGELTAIQEQLSQARQDLEEREGKMQEGAQVSLQTYSLCFWGIVAIGCGGPWSSAVLILALEKLLQQKVLQIGREIL